MHTCMHAYITHCVCTCTLRETDRRRHDVSFGPFRPVAGSRVCNTCGEANRLPWDSGEVEGSNKPPRVGTIMAQTLSIRGYFSTYFWGPGRV